MTEQEWLEWCDPGMMLRHLLRGRAGERKLRLFAVACCRRVWHLLREQSSRRAVELAESYADGLASEEELVQAAQNARSIAMMLHSMADDLWSSGLLTAAYAADAAMWAATCPMEQADYARQAARSAGGEPFRGSPEPELQCGLLRDIFANPFRSPLAVSDSVLFWNDGCVVKLAQSAYDARLQPSGCLNHNRLAFLADALEEAGCTNSDILAHLRGPGPHVRGCWTVDLLLGKS
jgi:hypothetical protein